MKKIFFSVFLFLLLGVGTVGVKAQEEQTVSLYFFYGDGCPHCAKEEQFLTSLTEQLPYLKVTKMEVLHNMENASLLTDLGEQLQFNFSGVPMTVVGTQSYSGYLNESISGKKIQEMVETCYYQKCEDMAGQILKKAAGSSKEEVKTSTSSPVANGSGGEKLDLPLVGQINLQNYSLVALSVIIGFLDGFNPCAMWILIFLITLLLPLPDWKRKWLFGFTFIFASGLVYLLFMTAWLKIILFVGFIVWVRLAIGGFALVAGFQNLKEYWQNKDAVCKVSGQDNKKPIFEKLKDLVAHQSFWLSLVGLVVLAFTVNLLELVCSAGFPAMFTQVLALHNLPWWQYALYLLIYIFFYIIDDLAVFIIAMVSLKITGFSTKYTRVSFLVGGVLMIIIGILLILRPEVLMGL